jgi:hypothetical protein
LHQVVEALRALPLTVAVQRSLDRLAGSGTEYLYDVPGREYVNDGALSIGGREGNAEGLWEDHEEEALLLSVLLLISPENCWVDASPELGALRNPEHLPAVLREEVSS